MNVEISSINYAVHDLGSVGTESILLYTPETVRPGKNVLIAGGFHGNEPAGVLAIKHFLETEAGTGWENLNVSFIPVVNPTGLKADSRANAWGENPNRGFCHTEETSHTLSREGHVLMRHDKLLKTLTRDGFLTLHEDDEDDGFYMFANNADNGTRKSTETIFNTLNRHFEKAKDGVYDGAPAENGLVYDFHDGAFEDYLSHEGVPLTVCTETPSTMPMEKRITANLDVITSFIGLFADQEYGKTEPSSSEVGTSILNP